MEKLPNGKIAKIKKLPNEKLPNEKFPNQIKCHMNKFPNETKLLNENIAK